MKQVSGGVTAAKGFTAGGVRCGVKQGLADGNQPVVSSMADYLSGKKDLAMILSEKECVAAATYTLNRVKAAPLYITMEHLEDGVCRGVIANSGNANACAPEGHENAKRMCEAAAKATGLKPSDFVVASTGVIGQTLNIAAIEKGVPVLAEQLKKEGGSDDAAHAIMTTDTEKKEYAVSLTIGGRTVTIGAIAKGSGMIHPNMGTMLCFITTDCAITQEMLQDALHAEKLILLTDVRGLLRDAHDEYTLIHVAHLHEIPGLVKDGVISGGMIPKVDCCVEAVRQGVPRTHILDGRIPHSILIEMLSDKGIGTMIL